MITPIDESIIKRAVVMLWNNGQIIKCMEELGELQSALAKSLNPAPRHDLDDLSRQGYLLDLKTNVIEEIADVMIMVEQMSMIYGRKKVEEQVVAKQRRLADFLDKLESNP